MNRSVGTWQITVQFLINKLASVIDLQIETKLMYCLGAFVIKLRSTIILWDVAKLILAAITPDLKSHNQKSLLHAAHFIVKLRGNVDSGLKLSDSMIYEFDRLVHLLKDGPLVLLLKILVSLGINKSIGSYLEPYSCETMDTFIISSEDKDDYFLSAPFLDNLSIETLLTECAAQNIFESHVFFILFKFLI